MIVANKEGYSERNIYAAVAGEGFFLVIIMSGEIGKMLPGEWQVMKERWLTRLYPGGRLIIADSSEGIGALPISRNHSWVTPEEAMK